MDIYWVSLLVLALLPWSQARAYVAFLALVGLGLLPEPHTRNQLLLWYVWPLALVAFGQALQSYLYGAADREGS